MEQLDKYEQEYLSYSQTSDYPIPFIKFIMDQIVSKMDVEEKISFAASLCPDFESFHLDMVQIPILEKPSILVNSSVYPSKEECKSKVITFRKNFKTKSWDFDSKNF